MKRNLNLVIIFSLLLLSCNETEQDDQIQQWTYSENELADEIVRRYISPERIVWLSDESGRYIMDHNNLLTTGNGQADLVGENLCTLKGNDVENPSIVFDFGKELHGGLEIVTGMFAGQEPINVRLTFGESVSEAMSRVETSTATNDHAMRDFNIRLPWFGKLEVGNTGFRFVRIELLDKNRELKLKEVRAISIYRDIPYLGSFQSNDERLNKIWETGAYTVHLNMQDFLWDGIKRDRLVWVGDMHPEVMTILSVFGYNDVVPRSLDLIKEITELPSWMNGISSYSMWWILIQHQWYLNTGDKDYLFSHKDYIYGLMDVLKSRIDENGKEVLDGNRFLDWPTSPNKDAIHAGLQSLMVLTFETGIEIADIFSDEEKKQEYMQIAGKLKQHVPSPNGNKSGGALMILSGLADPVAMNDSLLSVNPTRGVSTFYGYYVLRARAEAGDVTGALNVIRKYWGGMLDLGATTFWEDFNLDWAENAGRIDEMPSEEKVDVHSCYGDYCYVGLRHSLAHGWASGPTAWMTEYVLGIEVLEPGCTKVAVKPNLGDLEWVEGTYPTPFGLIEVRHEKNPDGTINSEISAPEQITIVKNE